MVTVIIITRNRPAFLRRSLSYYSRVGFTIPIIVADSSDPAVCDEIESICFDHSKHLKIELLKFSENELPFAKISKAAKSCESPYIAIAGDDDFIIESALLKCAHFLMENPTYSVVDGRELRFLLGGDDGFLSYVLPQLDIEMEASHYRLESHLKKYWPTFYGVQRRENIEVLSEKTQNFNINDGSLNVLIQELYLSCLVVVKGKYKCIKDLYIVRQNEHKDSTEFQSWEHLIVDRSFSRISKKMRNSLALQCTLNHFSLPMVGGKFFNLGLTEFMKPFIPSGYDGRLYITVPTLYERIDDMRFWISAKIASLRSRIFNENSEDIFACSEGRHDLPTEIDDPETSRYFNLQELSSPSCPYFKELSIVLDFVKRFPEGKQS